MATPYSRTIVGGLPWYSVLVVSGIVLAIWLASREEKRLKLPSDTTVDLALTVIPCGIVGARLYYVIMRWEAFAHNPVSALYVWQGGLAIYGAVIGGALGALVYARRKKLSFAKIADMIAPGLLLAQAVGRWGNYFNMEAYGPVITEAELQFFPIAVFIPADGLWHAATFFYESVWNLLGFGALWMLRQKQKEAGNVFAWYLLLYGAGRFIIEQLREDSLYLGGLRVSQWLSLILCAVAAALLIWRAFQSDRKLLWGGAVCLMLWLARWGFLDQPAKYALLLAAAAVIALWMKRCSRGAIIWLGAALLLDGAGLLASFLPLSGEICAGIHAALCSATLPMGVWALCQKDD